MTVLYCGELTIGDALPGAQLAATAGIAGINAALPDILARIAALSAFVPQPVSFAAQLALAQSMVASVTSSIALGIPAPSIALQIAAIAALIAELLAQVSAINLQLQIVADFQGLLAAGGLHALVYSGTVGNMGGQLGTFLASGLPGGTAADFGHALILATTVGATWTALTQIAKVTP